LPRVRYGDIVFCSTCREKMKEIEYKFTKADAWTRAALAIYDPSPRRERLICRELKWINGINRIIAGYC